MSVDAGPTASTSLHKWLGRELEVRGIDAVIYTRYILSILQQDNADDMEHSDAIYFPPMSKKQGLHQSGGGGAGVKAKGRYHGTVGRGMMRDRSPGSGKGCGSSMNAEEMKKSAVMECLLSVSDQVQIALTFQASTNIFLHGCQRHTFEEMYLSNQMKYYRNDVTPDDNALDPGIGQ